MSSLTRFLKQNKKERENTLYPVSAAFTDENGEVLKWVIRPLTSEETERIREDCMYDEPVRGKPNQFRPKLNTSKYLKKMMVASVVEPNLNSVELQNSYGVMSAEDLIVQMLDNPGEYNDFAGFIQNFNNCTSMEDKVEEAKN